MKSDFSGTDEAKFSRQHHARVQGQNETHQVVTLFDNAKGTGSNEVASHDHSRGLLLALDMDMMKAELVAAYDHPHHAITNSRGSNQVLPDGNVFMCWAYHTLVSEHSPDGTVLMEAKLKKNIHTYRAYKFEWVGHPPQPPNVYSAAFVAGFDTSTIVHVSWNGATEVATWNIYQTDLEGKGRKLLASTPRHGFETNVTYAGYVVLLTLF